MLNGRSLHLRKRTFALHEKGLSGAPFLYQTTQPYPLYIAAPFFGPMMLDRPREGLFVTGELYDADDERLKLIDGLEDIGSPGSLRTSILVRAKGGGETLQAIVYVKGETWPRPLHVGPISDYQNRRFIPPWDR
jgi:gamma-glutamylaminecyclotransferase